jgi:hypothetical protein
MAIQIDEIRAAALANESYSGNLGGNLSEFYRVGGGDPDIVLTRLETEWLRLLGYTDLTLPAQWHDYLAHFGFTGTLLGNLQTEANLRHLFPQPPDPTVFALLLESGEFLLSEDGFHILNN